MKFHEINYLFIDNLYNMSVERMIFVKRLLVSLFTAGSLLVLPCYSNAAVKIPMDVYQWVQSTARSTYYFNRQSICYGLNSKGFVDLNILLVPVVKTYDGVQKDDIISKRRWKNLPVDNYNQLVASAFYLSFNLNDRTVQVTKRIDLDENWGELGNDTTGKPIKLDTLSGKDVEGKFYRSVLKYAAEHQAELLKHTNGKLSQEDESKLEEAQEALKLAADLSKNKSQAEQAPQTEQTQQVNDQHQAKDQAQQTEQPQTKEQAQTKEQPQSKEQPQQNEQPQAKEQPQTKEQPQLKKSPQAKELPQQTQVPPCCQNCPYCQQFMKNNGK